MSQFDRRVDRSVKSATEQVKSEIMDLLLDDDPRLDLQPVLTELGRQANMLQEIKSELSVVHGESTALAGMLPSEFPEDEQLDPSSEEEVKSKLKELPKELAGVAEGNNPAQDWLDAFNEALDDERNGMNKKIGPLRLLNNIRKYGVKKGIFKTAAGMAAGSIFKHLPWLAQTGLITTVSNQVWQTNRDLNHGVKDVTERIKKAQEQIDAVQDAIINCCQQITKGEFPQVKDQLDLIQGKVDVLTPDKEASQLGNIIDGQQAILSAVNDIRGFL